MDSFQTGNSRFLYIETQCPDKGLSYILKELLLFIDQSKDIEAYGDSVLAYFDLSDPVGARIPWKIGKQITGHPGRDLPNNIQFEDFSSLEAIRFPLDQVSELSFRDILVQVDKVMEQAHIHGAVRSSRLNIPILGAGYTNRVYLELILVDSM